MNLLFKFLIFLLKFLILLADLAQLPVLAVGLEGLDLVFVEVKRADHIFQVRPQLVILLLGFAFHLAEGQDLPPMRPDDRVQLVVLSLDGLLGGLDLALTEDGAVSLLPLLL